MTPLSPAHRALGVAVRELRGELREPLSQESLANRSGLHRTYVGAIERGERNVSYANIRRVGAEVRRCGAKRPQ